MVFNIPLLINASRLTKSLESQDISQKTFEIQKTRLSAYYNTET